MNVEVLFVLLLTALACAVIGWLLLLRRLSMMTDAISHSILLGIVIMHLMGATFAGPWLFLGGLLTGVATYSLINALQASGRVNEDAAIGIVFPLFFGLAVMLISLFAGNIHLDIDAVLLGEVIFTPLVRMELFGRSVPVALVAVSLVLLINVVVVTLFYKELKLATFDSLFAMLSGISVAALQYMLIALVSMTAVVAFDVVGSVLVIAFIVGPTATARIIGRNMGELLVGTVFFALLQTFIGYALAVLLDVSVAGMIATVIGVMFIGVTICSTVVKRWRQRHVPVMNK